MANYKLAALGKGTAQALLSIGAQPNFIGKGNDTEEIAHQFLDILGDKKVYFPISNRSLGKVHSVIPENQRVVEIAYTTESVKINLPENCEIVVFTSPSNAESFVHLAHQLSQKHLVCIGKSTLEFVKNNFPNSFHYLSSGFEEDAIIQSVLSILKD